MGAWRRRASPAARGAATRLGPVALLLAGLGRGLLPGPAPAEAQEILQAQVLDLTALEVQVIVWGADPDDRVQCLLRDDAGRVRVGGTRALSAGRASGRSSVVSVPLPLPGPTEREYAVLLLRGETVLHQVPWRALFPLPARGRSP